MANTAKPRWDRDNYQVRVFWENALNLLYDYSCVVEVTFEANNPKSFDGVVVRYDPPVPRSQSKRINAEYKKSKMVH